MTYLVELPDVSYEKGVFHMVEAETPDEVQELMCSAGYVHNKKRDVEGLLEDFFYSEEPSYEAFALIESIEKGLLVFVKDCIESDKLMDLYMDMKLSFNN